MQDVNNDMDDLFRRAAEQYPLKTDGANWQKVSAGLQAASMPVAEEKEKRKRRALWLFLLLPLGLLWSVYYKSDNQPVQRTEAAKGNAVREGSRSSLQKPDFTLTEKRSLKEENTDNITSSFSSREMMNGSKISAGNNDKDSSAYNGKESMYKGNKTENRSTGFVRSEGIGNSDNKRAVTGNYTSAANNNKNNFSAQQPEASSDRIDKKDVQESNNDEAVAKTIPAKTDSIAVGGTKKDSAANNTADNENKRNLAKVKPHVQHGLYAGLLASFDISTIKLQRINKIGYGLQVLAGYRFSDRLSIESGLGKTVKKYYSKGKYFDKKKTGIPDIINIYYTNGYCKMLEVPLSIKYDFTLLKKSNLFVTAGLSSYFMKKENYSYRGDFMGRVYDTTRYYNNSGANWFSLANFSIGYEAQLGRRSSLRIEPYIKVPLHGIGIANLPIASMGISAGFTRKF